MATLGKVNSSRYEILLHDTDMDLILRRRQVPVSGTHMYLKLIEPHPFNRLRKAPPKPSTVSHEQLKIKHKTVIHLNMDDYTLLKENKEVRIRSFYLRKELK